MSIPSYYNRYNLRVVYALESLYEAFREERELRNSHSKNLKEHKEICSALLDRYCELALIMGKVLRRGKWERVNPDVADASEDALIAADEKYYALKDTISELAKKQLNQKGSAQPAPDYRALRRQSNSAPP